MKNIILHGHPAIEMSFRKIESDEVGVYCHVTIDNLDKGTIESSFILTPYLAEEIISNLKEFLKQANEMYS